MKSVIYINTRDFTARIGDSLLLKDIQKELVKEKTFLPEADFFPDLPIKDILFWQYPNHMTALLGNFSERVKLSASSIVEVQITPLPQLRKVLAVTFPREYHLDEVVYEIKKSHVYPLWIAKISSEKISQFNKNAKTTFYESHTLFLEIHGIHDVVLAEQFFLESVSRERGCLSFDSFVHPKESFYPAIAKSFI